MKKLEHFHLRRDFPYPCVECGQKVDGIPATNVESIHYRVLFAVLERLRAGEKYRALATDYGLNPKFVRRLEKLK